MHSKKHILLFVTVLLAMALLVAGAAATAFAEDIAFTVTKPDSSVITYPAGTAFSTVIGEAPAGSTVTLFADADVATAFGINKNVTVDLNGHTLTTTNRITPAGTAHIIVKNGTVEITKMELVYMDEGSSKDATFEFNSVTLKKGATAPNKLLADMRVGTIVFDGVTVNEGEWSVPASSANPLISMGYRTKEVSQTVKLVVKNSNIKLSGNSLANGSGASNETNGYTLDIDVSNSYISSTTAIFTVRPNAAGTMENNYIDICVTDGSELWSSTPISVNANVNKDHITFMLDYGVTSKKPTVGNVILGNDGNGVLDFVHGEFESSNTGTVADLWSNNQTPVAREDYAYTFVAVGDTQYITDSAHPEKLKLLYDWIINNKDAQNIQFVFGMGDITNHSRDDEWPVAMEQINRLNGVVPYSVVRGNHDTADTFNTNLNNETYRSMFDGFYSEDGAENAYLLFSVGEQDFLHITLDYHPSNAVLNWAAGIIQQYPMRKVIIGSSACCAVS